MKSGQENGPRTGLMGSCKWALHLCVAAAGMENIPSAAICARMPANLWQKPGCGGWARCAHAYFIQEALTNPPKSESQSRRIIVITGKLSHHLTWDTQQVIKAEAAWCVCTSKLGHSFFYPAPEITHPVFMLAPFGSEHPRGNSGTSREQHLPGLQREGTVKEKSLAASKRDTP